MSSSTPSSSEGTVSPETDPSANPGAAVGASAASASSAPLLDRLSLSMLGAAVLLSLVLVAVLLPGYRRNYHVSAIDRLARVEYTPEIIPHLEFAVAQGINPAHYGHLLGDVYFRLGHFEQALAAYQQVVKIAPDTKLQDKIAASMLELGNSPEANAALQRAIAENPASPIANYYLGRQSAEAGRYTEASERLFKTASHPVWNTRASALRAELSSKLFAQSTLLSEISKLPMSTAAATSGTTSLQPAVAATATSSTAVTTSTTAP